VNSHLLSSNVSQVSDGIDDPGLDRRLIEKTVELANKTKSFGSRQLRALDSSPGGASKVEDTYNLLGHFTESNQRDSTSAGEGLAEVADEMSASILATSSLKAADLNWDEPDERNLALGMVWDVLERVEIPAISNQ